MIAVGTPKRTDAARAKDRAYEAGLRKRAFDLIGDSCVFCGSTENLHAAHVVPTGLKGPGRGLKRRCLDAIKNPTSYAPMCPPCHRTFDRLVSRIKQTVIVEEPIPF